MEKEKKNYFKEEEFKRQLKILNSPRETSTQKNQQYNTIITILQDLNLRVLNTKFEYFVNRYNLVQNINYLNIEKTELLQDILSQQLGQLKRFDDSRNTKFFSFLTQIQENVIKYKIQNLVKETNYFVYLDGMRNENNENEEISGQDFIVQQNEYITNVDYKNVDNLFIKLNFEQFKSLSLKEFFERFLSDEMDNIEIQKFLIVYEKYMKLIELLKSVKSNYILSQKVLNQIMILNRYLLYFYYKSIRVKKRYKKKKKKSMNIFEIEQKLKYVRNFSSIFFKVNTTIDLNDLYELFEY